MLILRALPAVLCLLLAAPVWANAAPPIPPPSIGLCQAVEIAERALLEEAREDGIAEFFAQSALYSDRTPGGDRRTGWAWFVTLVHPVRNDRSFTFRIDGEGRAELVSITE